MRVGNKRHWALWELSPGEHAAALLMAKLGNSPARVRQKVKEVLAGSPREYPSFMCPLAKVIWHAYAAVAGEDPEELCVGTCDYSLNRKRRRLTVAAREFVRLLDEGKFQDTLEG